LIKQQLSTFLLQHSGYDATIMGRLSVFDEKKNQFRGRKKMPEPLMSLMGKLDFIIREAITLVKMATAGYMEG